MKKIIINQGNDQVIFYQENIDKKTEDELINLFNYSNIFKLEIDNNIKALIRPSRINSIIIEDVDQNDNKKKIYKNKVNNNKKNKKEENVITDGE